MAHPEYVQNADIRAFVAELEQEGLLDMATAYGYDESDQLQEMEATFGAIKARQVFTREGQAFTREGRVFTREGIPFTREGQVFTRKGMSFTREPPPLQTRALVRATRTLNAKGHSRVTLSLR